MPVLRPVLLPINNLLHFPIVRTPRGVVSGRIQPQVGPQHVLLLLCCSQLLLVVRLLLLVPLLEMPLLLLQQLREVLSLLLLRCRASCCRSIVVVIRLNCVQVTAQPCNVRV